MISFDELKIRQAWPLERKIEESWNRIFEWYVRNDGKIYTAVSGGLDSTVLYDLVKTCPELSGITIPAVFIDTGLEFPENRRFVRTLGNVEVIKPKMGFKDVLEKYGYPVISKRVSQYIHEINRSRSETNLKKLRLTGIKPDGDFSQRDRVPLKYQYLQQAPFKISHICCRVMKKSPALLSEKLFGAPMMGITAEEGDQRFLTYRQYGCNAFDLKRPRSWPMAFWTHDDVWEYIRTRNLRYSEIYDMGYRRSGCVFCMFGVHLEKEPNRFQLLHDTHPKLWKYCMEKLDIQRVLDFIGVPSKPGGQMSLEIHKFNHCQPYHDTAISNGNQE